MCTQEVKLLLWVTCDPCHYKSLYSSTFGSAAYQCVNGQRQVVSGTTHL